MATPDWQKEVHQRLADELGVPVESFEIPDDHPLFDLDEDALDEQRRRMAEALAEHVSESTGRPHSAVMDALDVMGEVLKRT